MNARQLCSTLLMGAMLSACGGNEPVSAERYAESDAMTAAIRGNIATVPHLSEVAEIDHSRLGHEAGSPMPPARVVIFSDKQLTSIHSRLLLQNGSS